MRIFHTKTNVCGVSQVEHASAIGRLHPSCEPTHIIPKPCALRHSSKDSFEIVSKHDAMLGSLRDGRFYYLKQISGLSRAELLLRQILSVSKDPPESQTSLNGFSKREFFQQSFACLTSEKYKSYPVFGHGHETPLKLHVSVEHKRITKLLSPSPLLSKPAFKSLVLTLSLNDEIKPNLCEESVSEVINLMLDARSFEEDLNALERDVRRRAIGVENSFCTKPKQLPGFFMKLKSRFYKSLNHRLPRPLPEIPI